VNRNDPNDLKAQLSNSRDASLFYKKLMINHVIGVARKEKLLNFDVRDQLKRKIELCLKSI